MPSGGRVKLDGMNTERLHRVSARAVLVLSFLGLFTVLTGYFQAPQPDEGTAAHIFQLTIVLLCPMFLIFLAAADWSHARRVFRTVVPACAAVAVSFAALYYLEHVWYARAALHNLR
jgi:hypothetical protein